MLRKHDTLEDLERQRALIAEAVRVGSLRLAIPSCTGDDRLLGELPPDHLAVDYIIQSPEPLK